MAGLQLGIDLVVVEVTFGIRFVFRGGFVVMVDVISGINLVCGIDFVIRENVVFADFTDSWGRLRESGVSGAETGSCCGASRSRWTC